MPEYGIRASNVQHFLKNPKIRSEYIELKTNIISLIDFL